MSLVGTRPPTVDEWEKYELHHRSRMSTKPGITGMWQVSGRSDITDFEEVVRLDTEYIEHWTMGYFGLRDVPPVLFKYISAEMTETSAMFVSKFMKIFIVPGEGGIWNLKHHHLPLLRAAQPGCGGQRFPAHHRIHDGAGRLRVWSGR